MKTILVATDFSDASRNASLYAVEMAKAFHARLILFTAYRQMSVPANESALIGASEDMGKVSQQLLELEAKAIYSEKEISLEISYKEGFTTDAILETASSARTGHAGIVKALLAAEEPSLARSIPLTKVAANPPPFEAPA